MRRRYADYLPIGAATSDPDLNRKPDTGPWRNRAWLQLGVDAADEPEDLVEGEGPWAMTVELDDRAESHAGELATLIAIAGAALVEEYFVWVPDAHDWARHTAESVRELL